LPPDDLLTMRAQCTVAIPGKGKPGQVLVALSGGTQTFLAYSDEEIEKGAQVVVVDQLDGQRLVVALA
jgi:hypothetical protein